MKRFFIAVLAAVAALLTPAGVGAKELKPFTGGATPALTLPAVGGRMHNLEQYRGHVVLVNFWATWCPPCVHEMPSMQRLKDRMAGQPFAILAVDMGETEAQIREFVKEVKVDFTILMDRDGKAIKEWKVFVFPTSYLVDKSGRIRYGVLGAKEWDDADALRRVGELLAETPARSTRTR